MRPHPFLRAYMAGIAVPTVFLVVVVTVFATFRFYVLPEPDTAVAPTLGWALSLERLGRAIMFPMAVVPNLWGLWNMSYLAVRRRTSLPLGLYGALLPLVLVPLGIVLARTFAIVAIDLSVVLPLAGIAMAVYYLVWKHIVGFLNQEMGIA